jgi:hypothetical protein
LGAKRKEHVVGGGKMKVGKKKKGNNAEKKLESSINLALVEAVDQPH